MGVFLTFVCIYLFGGLTLLPLTICLVLLHAHLTFPHIPSPSLPTPGDTVKDDSDDGQNIRPGAGVVDAKLHRSQEREFGGYFAVCREWIPGGVNGKPPERTTPAGEVIAEESPSVYQSMYRSLFDRRQAPTMETVKVNGKPTKRARNVFYIVLRHGHLMLYDDSEQVEVRFVISLALHNVSVYAGGDSIPEGELWIKRNALCLTRKSASTDILGPISKPFYLFSENCSEKEDFYFALLQFQERDSNDRHPPPIPQQFEVGHIVGLVQKLHSSEEQLQTRWFNALVSRLFLGLYKTQQVEDFIRLKITKKISRVNKPAFLSGIVLRKIDMGNSAPFITNPRLKDLTVEGDCVVAADVNYSGRFGIEVATTARIDLGARFKAREVNLVLAITLKKLEGHMLVRFKTPPSNRVWIAFETMPQLEMQIEPIVSSRQVTYGIILRAIESRIREVLAETLVLPHWDDSPFLSTLESHFRGGIWVNDQRDPQQASETIVPDEAPARSGNSSIISGSSLSESSVAEDRAVNVPVLLDNQRQGISSRKGNRPTISLTENNGNASSSGVERGAELPRSIRSKSFASAASPIVSTDNANSNFPRKEPGHSKDAASFMTEISNRSQPTSPGETPLGSASSSFAEKDKVFSGNRPSSRISDSELNSSQITLMGVSDTLFSQSPSSLSARSTGPSVESSATTSSKFQNVARGLTPSEKKQQSLAAAALAAKNWGWKTLSKGKSSPVTSMPERTGTPENPIGRGRPLPPPGQPLPLPEKPLTPSFISAQRRKPLPLRSPQSQLAEGRSSSVAPQASIETSKSSDVPNTSDGLLVVEAPYDSEPSSPSCDWGEFQDNVSLEEDKDGIETRQEHEASSEDTDVTSKTKRLGEPSSYGIREGELLSTSYEDDARGLTSWQNAQEEEARSQSVWMDEKEHG